MLDCSESLILGLKNASLWFGREVEKHGGQVIFYMAQELLLVWIILKKMRVDLEYFQLMSEKLLSLVHSHIE